MSSIYMPLVVVAIVFAAVAWQIFRRPVSRRLALRNARRRPTESLLVVAGTALGAALITGSLVVGDTLDASQRATAATQLGPVDEMMTLHDLGEAKKLERLVGSLDDPRIDGVTTIVTAPAPAAAGNKLAEPKAEIIEVDFDDARRFGDDPAATGIAGSTPDRGEAVVTEDVAGPLGLVAGDQMDVYIYGRKIDLEVDRVVERKGIAGFQPDQFRSTSPNIFVAPGTVQWVMSNAEMPVGAMPPHARVLVSNEGGVEEGGALTKEVTTAIERVLPEDAPLVVEPLKQKRLDTAESSGEFYGQMFVSVGAFALIAGILLLVSIFVMLAEERKRELGMLRAVGMRRADLVRAFVIEGSVYALAASAIGALIGIGIGWAIVRVAAPIFGGDGGSSIELLFAAKAQSVVTGFSLGVLIALLTVFFTSLRVSRLNVIRAIRDLPEITVRKARKRSVIIGTAVALVGAGWSAGALSSDDAWQGAILGPVSVLAGLFPALSLVIGRKRSLIAVSTAALLWGMFGNSISGGKFFASGEMPAYVAQGVLITFAAVILLSHLQESLGRALRVIASRFLSLRLGTAYPIANRLRTGLTLSMYSLVVFTLVFVASLSGIFSGQVDRLTKDLSGGFDVVVTANAANPPARGELARSAGSARIVPALAGTAMFVRQGKDPQQWWATGIDRDFVAGAVPALSKRGPGDTSDEETWARLVEERDSVIIPPMFLHVGGDMAKSPEPGDVLRTIDPSTGALTKHHVIGILDADPTNMGVVMAKDALADAAPGTISGSRFYVDVDENMAEVVTRLEGDLVENGVDADSFRSIVEASQSDSVQFLRLLQGFLALGLVVGIAGLGIVMVRAVRERRLDIGTLRALGFLASRVRRVFIFESAFIAFEGIALGTILGLVTASQLAATGDLGQGAGFSIPWMEVMVLAGTAFVVSIAATAWPAFQASRIPPATALRITD